nr:cytoplasmic tRNA 2-thiolation protein 1 [Tanacetum cinerariifolium]
ECFYEVFEEEIHRVIIDNNLFKCGECVTISASCRKDSTVLEYYGLSLKVVDLYGWTMDEIVKMIGLKNNYTFCGVFCRLAFDNGAALLKVDKLVTRHNADDIA